MSTGNGHNYDDIGTKIDGVGADIAKAALGIPDDARVHTFDVSTAALFVVVERDGMAKVNATVPKREAAGMLRHIADLWDQEWKAEEHAAQKAKRTS